MAAINQYPNPCFFLLKGGRVVTMANVDTHEDVDTLYYDSSSYRDEINSTFLGRAVAYASNTRQVSIASSNSDTTTITDEGGGSFSGSKFVNSGTPGSTDIFGSVFTTPDIDQMAIESDSYTHEPPRAEQKTRTERIYKDGDSKVVGRLFLDQLVSTSATKPTFAF